MAKNVLELLEEPVKPEKVVKKPKDPTPIYETLRQLKEQIDNIPIIDLTPIQLQLDDIKQSLNTLITLMEKKIELDEKEAIILDLLKKNMEKGS